MYIFTAYIPVLSGSDVRVTVYLVLRKRKMGAVHKATAQVVGSLQYSDLRGFITKSKEIVEWWCESLLASY